MLGTSALSWAMGITKGVGGVPPGREPGFLQSPVDGGPGLVRSLPTSCGDGPGEASSEAMGAAPRGAGLPALKFFYQKNLTKRGHPCPQSHHP